MVLQEVRKKMRLGYHNDEIDMSLVQMHGHVQVFDDKATFAEWFGDALGKGIEGGLEEEWLATEKRVVVIHRLHQILEPFMLRRQVEDVESKLPSKARSPRL